MVHAETGQHPAARGPRLVVVVSRGARGAQVEAGEQAGAEVDEVGGHEVHVSRHVEAAAGRQVGEDGGQVAQHGREARVGEHPAPHGVLGRHAVTRKHAQFVDAGIEDAAVAVGHEHKGHRQVTQPRETHETVHVLVHVAVVQAARGTLCKRDPPQHINIIYNDI